MATICVEIRELNVYDARHVQQYLEAILEAFNQFRPAKRDYERLFPPWKVMRTSSIAALVRLADGLDTHKSNCNISKVVNSCISAAGCVAAIGGSIAITIATVGAAAPVIAAVGGSIGAAGGLASAGTYIAQGVIENKEAEKAQKILKEDEAASESLFAMIHRTEELEQAIERIMKFEYFKKILEVTEGVMQNIQQVRECIPINGLPLPITMVIDSFNLIPTETARLITLLETILQSPECSDLLEKIIVLFSIMASFLETYWNLFESFVRIYRVLNAAADVGSGVLNATRVTTPALRAAAALGIVLSSVSLAIDIVTVVLSSKDMIQGSKSTLAANIRVCVVKMQEELDALETIFHHLI